MIEKTDWRVVLLAIGSGWIAGLQVGKVPVALPLLRHDLGLSLSQAGLAIAVFSALGALGGLGLGILVTRFGPRATITGGLLIVAVGSLAGAFATDFGVLVASRIVEGCGAIAVTIAAPALISSVTAPRDRYLTFPLWGTYMPGGIAAMMLAGPLIERIGWQPLWVANAVLAALVALISHLGIPGGHARPAAPGLGSLGEDVRQLFRAPGPLLIGLIFGSYTFQYFAVSGMLPTLLVERLGLSVGAAGTFAALAVVANGVGTLSASVVMRFHLPLWAALLFGFLFTAAVSPVIFGGSSVTATVALAAAAFAAGGIGPALVFAAVPRLAPAPPLIPLMLGLNVQAANIGQFLGPAVIGVWVERLGWASAPWIFVAVAVVATVLTLRLRTVLRDHR